MKKIFLSVFLLIASFGISQSAEVETISANLIPKTKRLQIQVNNRTDILYQDTAYTLAIAVKMANLGDGDKLVIKIGTLQNDSIGANRRYTVKFDPNNLQRVGEDVEPFVQIGEITDGFLMIFFDLPESDLVKIKKVTAFVKSNGTNSQKRYYDFD